MFDDATIYLIKDLVSYMIVMSSAAFRHFESYGFSHPLWSERAYSDSYITGWLKENIKITQVEECVDLWATMHIGKGRCLVCYDSTNINSVAEGISLVEKGHAKDDPTKPQIDIDYVVKQLFLIPFIPFPVQLIPLCLHLCATTRSLLFSPWLLELIIPRPFQTAYGIKGRGQDGRKTGKKTGRN